MGTVYSGETRQTVGILYARLLRHGGRPSWVLCAVVRHAKRFAYCTLDYCVMGADHRGYSVQW